MADKLEALARRVEENPDFLAFTLADYARSEKLSDAALAVRLGCDIRKLIKLRLCRRPRSGREHFLEDVTRIASAFDIDRDILLEAVRRADALVALLDAAHDSGFLIAARDRDDNDSPPTDDEEAT